jgi:hypothetical protein
VTIIVLTCDKKLEAGIFNHREKRTSIAGADMRGSANACRNSMANHVDATSLHLHGDGNE